MGGEEFGFDAYARPRINPQAAFNMGMAAPYPLLFKPILLPKVWGGRRLERYGKVLPPGQNVGESWELADLGATSLSGAGGGAARSEIVNGVLRGQTLDQAMQLWGGDLLGSVRPTDLGSFPLLVKILDARENLSVQVHPNPAYAAAHPGAHLKDECWFVLEADPGAVIYKGLCPGLTRDRFERHVHDSLKQAGAIGGWRGTESMPDAADQVVEDLLAVPAVAGECHSLPSGTCHSLGAGVMVLEVQTPSDTTFRVYDWGRVGRELHVEQAMQCIDFGPPSPPTRLEPGTTVGRLATTASFTIDKVRLRAGGKAKLGPGCTVVVQLRAEGAIAWGAGSESLKGCQTALVPAAVNATYTAAHDTSLLVIGLGA